MNTVAQKGQRRTSGPWGIAMQDALGAIITDGRGEIASVRPWMVRPHRDLEEAHAIARLIAAAPDLLEACKAALGALAYDEDKRGYTDVVEVLEAAIAQAEGKE